MYDNPEQASGYSTRFTKIVIVGKFVKQTFKIAYLLAEVEGCKRFVHQTYI